MKILIFNFALEFMLLFVGRAQSVISINYDINGNRLTKKLQGNISNPTIAANPSSVSLGQAVMLTASNCLGTVNWSNGQQGASISVTPTITTQYTASCITANCTTNGIGQITVEVFQCQPDAIGVTSSAYKTQYGQAVALTAYGCPGTVQWSNGQTGFTITPQVYGATSTFTATCSKRNCPNSGSGSINIAGIAGCNPGDVMVTIQPGDWNATTTWACGRVPTSADEVYLVHTVTVGNTNNYAKSITLGGGYVISQNSGYVNLQPN